MLNRSIKVGELHPKDIVVVQAMHIAQRAYNRLSYWEEDNIPFDIMNEDVGPSVEYINGRFLERDIRNVKAIMSETEDFMCDLMINYHTKEEKNNA